MKANIIIDPDKTIHINLEEENHIDQINLTLLATMIYNQGIMVREFGGSHKDLENNEGSSTTITSILTLRSFPEDWNDEVKENMTKLYYDINRPELLMSNIKSVISYMTANKRRIRKFKRQTRKHR